MEFSIDSLTKYHDEVDSPFGHTDSMIRPGGGISLTEGKTMYALMRYFQPKRVIESGTHMGNSAWFIAQALRKNNAKRTDVENFGHLITVDRSRVEGMRANDLPEVTAVKQDIIEWMKESTISLAVCDFFNHDDDHGKEHIMEEMDILLKVGSPKVITFHDAQTESKDFWDMVKSTPEYLPQYERFEVLSLMGIGILVRKE